ncbi:hypothetical protein GCM10010411_40560 [Actinomadura fulvescens]|uniref:Uncharacterized protein n=1 Tax=Actinomadura fulvescens TaxID=46160 RepID=A0ABN3PV11_9ACTN
MAGTGPKRKYWKGSRAARSGRIGRSIPPSLIARVARAPRPAHVRTRSSTVVSRLVRGESATYPFFS